MQKKNKQTIINNGIKHKSTLHQSLQSSWFNYTTNEYTLINTVQLSLYQWSIPTSTQVGHIDTWLYDAIWWVSMQTIPTHWRWMGSNTTTAGWTTKGCNNCNCRTCQHGVQLERYTGGSAGERWRYGYRLWPGWKWISVRGLSCCKKPCVWIQIIINTVRQETDYKSMLLPTNSRHQYNHLPRRLATDGYD